MKFKVLTIFSIVFILMASQSINAQGLIKKHGIEIQKIIKKDEVGIIRGYDFNSTYASIKASEDAKLEADLKTSMIYKVQINDKEFCEIIYSFDAAGKLKNIGLEFFEMPGAKPEEQIVDDFQSYFTERFGHFKVNDKDDEVWTSKDGSFFVELSDETQGDMIQIEIEIYKK